MGVLLTSLFELLGVVILIGVIAVVVCVALLLIAVCIKTGVDIISGKTKHETQKNTNRKEV